jgi:hypothetical protein
MENKQTENKEKTSAGGNSDLEGNDKAPGEEQEKKEKVTVNDLKGKKVDGDPSQEADQPLKQ